MRAREHDLGVHAYRAVAVMQASASVAVLQLVPAAGSSVVRYRAGQYVTVELNDGTRRAYSPATGMQADGRLELHVQLYAEGRFSQRVKQGADALGLLKVRGPFGQCVWPNSFDQAGQAILLATGTGIAPIRALVMDALIAGKGKDIRVYWGVPSRDDLYLRDEFAALEQRYLQFHFIPVVSRESPGDKRYVQHIASAQHTSLAHAWVVACGKPEMVSAAAKLLGERNGLPASRFYADPFSASNTLPLAAAGASKAADMPTLTVNVTRPRSRFPVPVRVRAEGTLMLALRDAQLIQGVCNGQQSCGTCRLTLPKTWFDALPEATRSEARLLRALPGASPHDRLACQIALTPDLEGMQVLLTESPRLTPGTGEHPC
ncbi:FAD-binding oxidoreductase [Pseudomonas kitaguniensis]|uniref:FAD-binding oxidoreductase n=1 Tax=Pseudomonas kitaguniensis TaxID=2607908 RepID=UPI003CFDD2A2